MEGEDRKIQTERPSMVEWSTELTSRVIEEYRKHPVLWDEDFPGRKNRVKKINAWATISTMIGGVDVNEVQRKVHNLRNQWNVEHQKRHRNNSPDTDSKVKNRWPHYESLCFIQPTLEAKRARMMKRQDEQVRERTEEMTQHPNSPTPEAPKIQFQVRPAPGMARAMTPKRKKVESDEVIHQHHHHHTPDAIQQREPVSEITIQPMPTSSAASSEVKDEFAIFADYVASELRTITDRRALAVAKHNINTVLFEATTGMYDQQANGT